MSDGIKATTTVEIDWYTFGQHLAHRSSQDQAAFLDGLSGGLHGLGAIRSAHQIGYIAEAVHGHTAWLAEEIVSATK